MSKKVISFICQSKGGVGKSALTYILANKFKNSEKTVFVDMDNETNTTSCQLSFFENLLKYNLIDSNTKSIDRAGFDTFFEEFINSENYNSAVCDLGATTSEQFLIFLKDDGGAAMLEAIKSMNIDIQIICVVAGMNAFPASSNYCKELFKSIKEIQEIKKIIIRNNFFSFSQEQNDSLTQLAYVLSAEIIDFNIVPNNVPGTLKEIHKLMQDGKSLDDAKTFTKIRIHENIKNLTLSI